MPDQAATVLAAPGLSRRRLIALIGGGALTGAVWTTGLSVLARGRYPQLFVLGSGGWQVVLLEHGTTRVVLLLGEFEVSPESDIDLLCGLLRQHIDVVVGDGEALRMLSSTFRERRAVSTLLQTGASSVAPGSGRYRWLPEPVTLQVGTVALTIEPLPSDEWLQDEMGERNWIAHATVSDITIALAPAIDTIAAHGNPDSTLAIAPRGDVARLWRLAPGTAVATNARETIDAIDPSVSDSSRKVLVRTFRRDIAAFVVKDGRLTLPNWAEASPT